VIEKRGRFYLVLSKSGRILGRRRSHYRAFKLMASLLFKPATKIKIELRGTIGMKSNFEWFEVIK